VPEIQKKKRLFELIRAKSVYFAERSGDAAPTVALRRAPAIVDQLPPTPDLD
jgi:hypothetical protein